MNTDKHGSDFEGSMTTDVVEEKNIYLSNFEQFEKSVDLRAPIHEVRKAAIDRFAELGFPTTWDEEWRFTNVAPLAKIPFRLASTEGRDGFDGAKLEALVPTVQGHRLVFVNGHYVPELSSHEALPAGVVVHSLAAVLQAHPDWV